MSSEAPIVEDLRIVSGAVCRLSGWLIRLYDDTVVTDVADREWTLKFRRSDVSTTVLLDASARVVVADGAQGWVQAVLTTTDTAALEGTGVWDLAMDDEVIAGGRWTSTQRVSR